MAVVVGAEYNTFDDLTNAIRTYEAENFVNLIIRDTRTVECAAKRNQRKKYSPAIKYSDISYCCTYGGKKYVCHSTGKRNHKTIKQACPFSLKVRATVDGQRLFIREMCTSHNHQLSEADFRLHPKQRKLDIGSQEEIANLLSMEPDKKLLRDKLMQITGKVILMKDIHNIKTRLVNTKIKQKDCKRELVENTGEEITLRVTETKIETAEMETQTEEEDPDEICLPIPHHASTDTSHHSIIFHQSDQHLETDVRNCYLGNQTYQPQSSDPYTGNLQTFQPVDIYNVSSQSFQQSHSDIPNGVHQTDPNVRHSEPFQHWTTLEDVGRQAVQESRFQTVAAYQYPDQQNNSYSTHLSQQTQHIVHVSSPQPMQPVLISNIAISQANQQQEDDRLQHEAKKSRKQPTKSMTREKKKRLNSDQKDKEMILKKYFQQATVNLFFNERMNSPESKFLKTLRPSKLTARMSEGQTDTKFHDMLKPLSWLFGKWQGVEGKGKYPGIKDFSYAEEAEFRPVGLKPVVEYNLNSWKADSNTPLHRESGYIRIKPGTNHIAFMGSHTMGVVEVQEGEVGDQELAVETKTIGRTTFNNPPAVEMIRRNLKRKGSELEQILYMQTDRTDLTEHLRITFKKVE